MDTEAPRGAGSPPGLAALADPELDALFLPLPRGAGAWSAHAPFVGWLLRAVRPAVLACDGGAAVGAALRRMVEEAGLPTRVRGPGESGAVDLLHLDAAALGGFEAWRRHLSGAAVVLVHGIAAPGHEAWAGLAAAVPSFAFTHAGGLGILCPGAAPPVPVLALVALPPAQADRLRARMAALGAGWSAGAEADRLAALLLQAQEGASRAEARAAEAVEAAGAAAEAAGRARARIAESRAATTALRRALAQAHADAAVTAAELAASHARLIETEGAVQAALADAARLRATTSWRATAPLRRVAGSVPPPLRPLLRPVLRHGARAAWWAATPWRIPARLRVLRAAPPAAAVLPPPEPELPHADPYAEWIAASEPPAAAPENVPPLSLLLPATDPGPELGATLDSLQRQTAGEWTLLAPDTDAVRAATAPMQHDRRLRLISCEPEQDRAGVLATLLAHVADDWFAVLDSGDTLAATALGALGTALAEEPQLGALYADEDRVDDAGRRHAPRFKPEWSPQLLQCFNYFGRPTVLSRAAAQAAGGFIDGQGAAAEWDLHLRLGERAVQHPIRRLPAVLCHRPPGSPDRPAPGTRAANEHRRALKQHWARLGPPSATVDTQPDGSCRSAWPPAAPTLVSVIVAATADDDAALRRCLNAVLDAAGTRDVELLLARTAPAAALEAELEQLGRVRIVSAEDAPTLHAAYDRAAASARGGLLLFLAADAEVTGPAGLDELVRVATLPGVGLAVPAAVGPDGTPSDSAPLPVASAPGVSGDAGCVRNERVVPGGCQLVRRDAFLQAGGFGERDLGDPALLLCLRLRRLGYQVAATPFATVIRPAATGGDPGATLVEAARLGHPGPVPHAVPPWFDLSDDACVLAAAALPPHLVLPTPDMGAEVTDPWHAARWVLALLRSRPDLRARFPRALSAGKDGAFAAWLRDGAMPLPPGLAGQLDAMWDTDPARRPREVHAWRDDVRAAHPAGLLPPGMAGLLGYLFRDGRREYGLRPEECWWFLLAAAEQPAAELVRTWRFTVAWQRLHPLGLTVFGAAAFAAWVAGRYGSGGNAAWLDPASWPGLPGAPEQLRLAHAHLPGVQARHPGAMHDPAHAAALLDALADPASGLPPEARAWCRAQAEAGLARAVTAPAVNVLGHFTYTSGLRVSVDAMCEAMALAGADVTRRAIRTRLDDASRDAFGGLEAAGITLLHAQPGGLFSNAFQRADLLERHPRTYRIGYWYWELDQAPADWAEAARHTDELWAATEFTAAALRGVGAVPVHALFPGVRLLPFRPRPREAFGAPARGANRFAFLFSFHMASIMERKNPLGLVRAFCRAFGPDEPVDLVLKTTSSPSHAGELRALRDAAAGHNVTILDRTLAADETLALMDGCDAYVSLHRAEGLGLTMAEAMLLGKPVIATRYSGNLHFMDDDNSLLVDMTLVPLARGIPPYAAGARWAEPSEAHAARLMRQLFDDRDGAAAIGRAGQASARRTLSLEAAGARMVARLGEIAAGRAG